MSNSVDIVEQFIEENRHSDDVEGALCHLVHTLTQAWLNSPEDCEEMDIDIIQAQQFLATLVQGN